MNNSTTLAERIQELQVQLSNCLSKDSDQDTILELTTELQVVCDQLKTNLID